MITTIEKANPPPLVKGLPGLGSALKVMKNPLEFLRVQYREMGSIFHFKAGPKNFVVMAGLEANRWMSEEGKECLVSDVFWGDLTEYWQCPHIIVAMDGPEHLEERKFLKNDIAKPVADRNQARLVSITKRILDERITGKAVSVRAMTRALINSELYCCLTDEELDLSEDLGFALTEYQRITFNVLVLKKWPRFMLWTPTYRKHRKVTNAFLQDLKAKTRAAPPDSGFFYNALKRHEENPGLRSEAELDFAFLAPFWAGLDTLGTTLVFMIHELIHNPDLYQRVTGAVDQIYEANQGQTPEPDALKQCDDLYGCCMEVLRLFPTAFGNGRTASCDFEFQGYQVKKGQDILMFTTGTHQDSEFFKDPERFDIERYREPRQEHKQRFAFSPYGRGPHICLGAAMSESMFLTTAATILRYYHFEAEIPGKRYPMIFDPSPSLSQKFKVKITKRHH